MLCFSCNNKDVHLESHFKDEVFSAIRTVNLENEDKSEVYVLNSDSTFTFINLKDSIFYFGKLIDKNDSTEFASVSVEKFNFLKSINSEESKNEDIELRFYDKTGVLIDSLDIETYKDNIKKNLLTKDGLIGLNSIPDSISIPVFEKLSGIKHTLILPRNENSFAIYLDINHQILDKHMNYKSPENKNFVMFSPLKELLK